MSETTAIAAAEAVAAPHHLHALAHRPRLDASASLPSIVVFVLLLGAGVLFALYGLVSDLDSSGTPPLAIGVFVLLGVALLIALGFEFVNGFHDTANAVATVIYTHSLPAQAAVIWSGCWNLFGVVTSTGAVAFSVISLLPVELILQVGSSAGFAMIFALLIAAIIWNLGTWVLGIPASSSHTLIGSIIGVGVANQLMAPAGSATSGVDWSQAMGVFRALLFSPLVGFACSALLLVVMKLIIRRKTLYQPPDTSHPPPLWIRGLLIATCTGVSFAHGSNDGQKGMGLLMLILIGAVPTAYALNHALPASATPAFIESMGRGQEVFTHRAGGQALSSQDARHAVEDAIRVRIVDTPAAYAGLARLAQDIGEQVRQYGAIAKVPAAAVQNVRNDMYLASEAVRMMQAQGLAGSDRATLAAFRSSLDTGTKFIPLWVKVSVAIALGLGTMIGWKRIVVTVGEKIGKSHLTYGQGASAEMIAAATIMAADMYGLPVSTTHVLSSGVAGTMSANGSGLQWSTVRSIALAWVLTLPAAILLAATLYYAFRMMV
jgi:PiT family inorganic phosphate transporter